MYHHAVLYAHLVVCGHHTHTVSFLLLRPFPVAGMEVELYDTTDHQSDIHINKKMVELGHLVPSSVPSSSECQPTLSLDPPRKRNSARAVVMLPG